MEIRFPFLTRRLRRFHFDFLPSELLTKDYTETYYREDGSRVTAAPEDIVRAGVLSPDPARAGGGGCSWLLCSLPQDHCYYHGTLAHHRHSSVSISTCDGLR